MNENNETVVDETVVPNNGNETTTTTTPVVEPTKATTGETTPEVKKLELDEKELEQRLVNKFAEGAKKAEKNFLDELGYKSKEELSEVIKNAKDVESKYQTTLSELNQLKAERMAIQLGANAEVAENVVALLKGKGQEISEENIKAAMAIFQGTKPASQGFGTPPTTRSTTTTKKQIPRVF